MGSVPGDEVGRRAVPQQRLHGALQEASEKGSEKGCGAQGRRRSLDDGGVPVYRRLHQQTDKIASNRLSR